MKFPLLVLLAAGALSAPFNNYDFVGITESKCDNPRRLAEHATSMFDYEGETLSTIQGSTQDSTGIRMRARIYVHPQGACHYSMQIIHAELLVKSKNTNGFSRAAESAKFAKEIEANTIVFKTSNGRIERIFPSAFESAHILNVKRGIISTLQLGGEENAEEVDVNGRCKVSITKENGMIVKSKNLSECSERTHSELGFQTASFEKKEAPIKPLNSTSRCVIKTGSDMIERVECKEVHIFRPFSAGFEKPAGAVNFVKQTLKLVTRKPGRVPINFDIESKQEGVSLAYQHAVDIEKPVNSIVERIDAVMDRLVSKTTEVKKQSANDFSQLVALFRKLDKKRMTPIMDKYFDCIGGGLCSSSETDLKSVYRQFILDALTYCATPTCVTTVRDIILKNEVSSESMSMFLQGIALVAKPAKEMIRDMKDIVEQRPSRQAFLTLGTLMHRFCRDNAEQCAYSKINPVTQVEFLLESKLGNGCNGKEDSEHVEELLMTLKAIGNAGRPFRAWTSLLTCAKVATHQNITTSALEALRRMPCSSEVQERLFEMLENMNLGPEKRIQVYIAIMRCPSEDSIRRVVRHLEAEGSKQVGSFIWSHLKNINESSDPRHANTKKFLAMVAKSGLKDFNLPFTRFSKAFEGSIYSKFLKSGGSVDAQLIYNPDSILPRSALLNFTANILDVPVNVFEMAARVEGIETLLENLFGPDGQFPDTGLVKIFNYTFSAEDRARLRSRRSYDDNVSDNIKQFHSQVNKKPVEPSGSLSVKILGNEVKVFSYDDIFWAIDQVDNMNVIDLLLKVARGGRKTVTKSFMFMEMTHTVPTGLGLPIKLNLKGSAVASMELEGKFDIRNMFWGPRSMEIRGYAKPSAVVDIIGRMGVSSHFVDTGIQVTSSMFTSHVIKGAVAYKEGKIVQVNIDAPEKPVEIFNISSTPFLFVNEAMQIVKGAPRRVSPDFCLNSKMVLGLGLCTSMSVPVAFREYESPFFPLSGPAHFGMKIVKADPKLTTYQLAVSLNKKTLYNGYQMTGTYTFGTPGATYSRGTSGIVKYLATDKVRRIVFGEFQSRNSVQLMIQHHNISNRFEVDFRSNLLTSKVMRSRFVFFNETVDAAKKIGVLMSAEYDWYKFQYTTHFTSSENEYSLRSRTTYMPGKYIQAKATYAIDKKDIEIKLEANQFNQELQMNGRYVVDGEEKGLKFSVVHAPSEKRSSLFAGIFNTMDAKRGFIRVTDFKGRDHEVSFGYMQRDRNYVVDLSVEIMGKTTSVFADFQADIEGQYGVDFGASYENMIAGISSRFESSATGKEACSMLYYNNKRPMKTCLKLKQLTAELRQLVWTTEVLKRVGEVSFELSNTAEKKGLTTAIKFNNKELVKNTMSFMFKSMWDTELRTMTEIGQRSLSARFYSERLPNSDVAFGVEAKAYNKMVKLQATYSTVLEDDATSYIVTVEGWVNKRLPASYVVAMKYGQQEASLRSTLNFREYRMVTGVSWRRARGGERIATRSFGIFKNDAAIFSSDISDTISISGETKFYKNEMRFTVLNKKFKYGWDIAFQNRCTDTQLAYGVTLGVDYARNRRSSISATMTNDADKAMLLINFRYIPERMLSHTFSYDKKTRQLDVAIEFLPKMYVKLMGRLDKIDGWTFTTDLKFSWSNYERVLTWVAAYTNQLGAKGLSFQFNAFNQRFSIASQYQDNPKTIIFVISAMGRSLRLTGNWLQESRFIGLRLLSESTIMGEPSREEIIELACAYTDQYIEVEVRRKGSRYMKTVAAFSKPTGSGYLELFVMDKSVLKTIGRFDRDQSLASFELLIRRKSIFKVEAEMKTSDALFFMRLFALGKERFQTVAKYDKKRRTAQLSFDALKKNMNAVFSANWNPARKEVTLWTTVLKRNIGVATRFDPINYVASMYGFYQKHIAGWSAVYDAENMAFAYNVTLTPRLSGQVKMEVLKDRIIAVTLQRKFGVDVVNEASFKYALGSDASEFIFHWNKDTTNKIRDTIKNVIVPAIKKAMNKATDLATKVARSGKEFSLEAVANATRQALRLVDEMDQSFDRIDFVAIRDKSGALAVSALRKSAELTNKALKLASKMLTEVHEKLPELMEKAKMYARKSVELTKMALEESKVLVNEASKIAQFTYKIAKNLTDSGIPVAKTALRLAKEFKVRGKTMEQILSDALAMSKKLAKSWRKNMSEKIMKAKTDAIVYIRNMPVPYRKEKLGELYVIYMNKFEDFRANFDVEEKARELSRKFMEYEYKGMTIAKHFQELRKRAAALEAQAREIIKTLPEDAKKFAVKMIGESRFYMKKVNKAMKKYKAAVQPIVMCVKKVAASIDKHFGPLVKFALMESKLIAKTELGKVLTPTKEMIARITAVVVKFMEPLLRPIKPFIQKIHTQISAIRVMEKEIGAVLDVYINEMRQSVEDRLSEMKTKMIARAEEIKRELKKIAEMTPEEAVVKAVDKCIELSVEAAKSTRDLYKRRQEILKKWRAEYRSYYSKAKEVYAIATSKPVEEMIHATFQMAGEAVIRSLKEFVKTVDQIASMDISRPFEEAWNQMDLMNHLERYGLHSKLAKMIGLAKDVNLTETLLKSIEAARRAITMAYATAEEKAENAFKIVDGVYRYVKSIPKKRFEDFYGEIEELYFQNQDRIYETVRKMISEGKNKLNEAVETAKKTYALYIERYYEPLKLVYTMLREKAVLVYNENKEECSLVFSTYRDIITGLTKEQYEVARKYVEAKYEMLKTMAEKRYEAIQSMAKSKYEEYYKKCLDFYRKYEDKTWDVIGEELYDIGEKYYSRASDRFEVELKRARAYADNAIIMARKYYTETRRLAEKYIAIARTRYENEVRPEAERLYARAVTLYRDLVRKVKKTSDEYYRYTVAAYKKAYYKAVVIYRANKDLSIRQLYRKIVALIQKRMNEEMRNMKELAKTQYRQAYNKIYSKVVELKEKAEKIRAEVMPIVLFEAESIFNQTLRAGVILANATVDAYTPHYQIVKAYTINYYGKGVEMADKYYKDALVSGKKYYSDAKVKSMEMYKKAIAKTEMQIQEITEYIKQILQRVTEHPKYKEITEHKFTKQAIEMVKKYRTKIEPKIAELKVKIAELRMKAEPKIQELKAKIEELKRHPKVAEIKQKIAEYRQQVMALREHEYVLKALEVLKQVKESGLFTFEQIKTKVSPYVEIVRLQSMNAPRDIAYYANFFRRDPAECVWTMYGKSKAVVATLRAYDWKSTDVSSMAKEFVRDVTDQRTKEAVEQMKSRVMECYKKCSEAAAKVPKMIKERASEFYGRQVRMVQQQYRNVLSSWKNCPLNPIVNHEIWGELVAEVKSHELVLETASIARQTVYVLDIYRRQFVREVRKYVEMKKTEFKARYNEAIRKVNAFLDETTLEDIVVKAVDSYETAVAKIEEQKQKFVEKINEAYEIAKVKYAYYKQKSMTVGKKYYAKAEKIWREEYPKIEAKARAMYEKTRQQLEKLANDVIRYSKDMRVKAMTDARKMWIESELRRGLITLKGMTVRETVAEIKKLPQKTKVLYGKALKVAQDKVEELKARYDQHLKPYVQRVEKVVMAVVDEVNATAVFVYRYYNLEGNMYNARDYLRKSMIEVREYVKDSAKQYKEIAVRRVKEVMPKIAPTMKKYAKKLAKATIKSVHTSMVFADNIDIKPYIAKIRKLQKYVPDLNKYVLLDSADNLLILRIPHHKPVEPSFSYQLKKVDRTVRNAANKITKDAVELTKKMIEYARNQTSEVREDFNASIAAHTVFGRYFYRRAVDVSSLVWSRSLATKEMLRQEMNARFQTAKRYVEDYSKVAMKKSQQVSRAVATFTKDAIVDVTYSNGIGEAYEKAERYTEVAMQAVKAELEPIYAMANAYAKKVYMNMSLRYRMMLYKTRPYYLIVKAAAEEWRNGAEFRSAFRVVEVQLRKAYTTAYRNVMGKLEEVKANAVDTINPKDVAALKEYLRSHKKIARKYINRLYRSYIIRKVKVDRYIRSAKLMLRKVVEKQPVLPYQSFAMIFGANHVMTFDGKFYDIPKFPTKTCTYLLARDFVNGKFTVMSQAENLIVQTPDMEVMIHQNGQVTSHVRVNKLRKTVSDLPVESDTGSCVSKKNAVVCEFKQGLRVRCHTDRFMCTIELSAWHYGKSQGLLGTNNNEMYDDFKTPSNTITHSVKDFVNSWLATRTGSCFLTKENNEAPRCNKAPSERCFELFNKKSSPFSGFFKTVDPLPFLKACLADTADCNTKQDSAMAHCNATAAYRRLLKSKREYAHQEIEDCLMHKKSDGTFVKRGEKWTQPITNDIDVVIIMSERAKARNLKIQIALAIRRIDRRLVKRELKTRYALVGFGGDKVQEKPHTHTMRGKAFADVSEVSRKVKGISFTGLPTNRNDIYGSISHASNLKFRPGARKLFILYNFDENKPCFFGPTLDETVHNLKFKANATLIAFDNFQMEPYENNKVIGQSKSRVYLRQPFKAVRVNDVQMPRSSLTKLVRISDGAMFVNKFGAYENKIFGFSVADVLTQSFESQVSRFQCCKMSYKHPKCRIANPMKC